MKITTLEVTDYQRVRQVEIHPGERALLVLGGENTAGKSSILSALEVAFGGKRHAGPAPVRHGENSAHITVELDDGALRIERKIGRDGKHTLEVREDGVRRKSPQKMLDDLVGARFLDPLLFLQADAKTQREMLLGVAKIEVDLNALAKQREDAFERRRDVNRELTRMRTQREELGQPEAESPGVSADDAHREYRRATELRDKRVHAETEIQRIDARGKQIAADIKELQARLEKLNGERDELKEKWKTTKAEIDELPTLDALNDAAQLARDKMDDAVAAASTAGGARERNATRTKLDGAIASAQSTYDKHQATIERIDAQKKEALEAAEMPIDGLEIAADHVIYAGAPLSQASDAQRLQVSLAIAAALSPQLRDIWVRDGSLLDEKRMAAMREFAEERDLRIWIERVGAGDDDAIIIEDGAVRP